MTYTKGIIDVHGNFKPVAHRADVLVMPVRAERARRITPHRPCHVFKFCPTGVSRAEKFKELPG
jgi:hypothetical protein